MALKLGDLPTIAITFIIIGVVIAIGLAVQSDIQQDLGSDDCEAYWNSESMVCQVNSTNTSTYSENSMAFNSTIDSIEGTAELADKLPLIGLVVGFAVLLGILGEFMFGSFKN